MLKDYLPWIIAGVVVLAVVLGGFVLGRVRPEVVAPLRWRRGRPPRDKFREGTDAPVDLKHAGIVVNPTKIADLAMMRERVTATCHAAGWGDPHFYETTVEDPGHGQALRAVADGASVVCSLGGDGTVRAVASALVGTETPLGLLPAGTGNLLARNLDLPVDGLDSAVTVALTGRNRRIDVGELVVGAAADVTEEGDPRGRHSFLVMAGMGMDAAIMAGTNENLKKKVGWPAYMVSGLKHLVVPEFRASISVDGDQSFKRRARFVVIGNCGRLLGGLVLMPNARVDDNQLDVVIASPRGVVGWLPVMVRVATRRRKGHATLDHRTCREVRVSTERAQPVQIDGDVIGEATEVTAVVRPACLTVRVPIG